MIPVSTSFLRMVRTSIIMILVVLSAACGRDEPTVATAASGTTGDIIAGIFLASDEAAYITGEAVNLSGGSVMH